MSDGRDADACSVITVPSNGTIPKSSKIGHVPIITGSSRTRLA